MSLKVDLSTIKPQQQNKNLKVDSIQIGDYVIKQTEPDGWLTIYRGEDEVAVFSDDDIFFGGKSITAIWKTLENHYEALKALLGQK